MSQSGPIFPLVHVSHQPNENETGISSNDQGGNLLDVISVADQPLYSGSDHSQLSAVARQVNIKSEYNLPQSCYDEVSQLIGELLPRDHTLPKDYYSTKKLIRELGLPVEKIDACKAGCMLFGKMASILNFANFAGIQEAWKHFNEIHPDFDLGSRNEGLLGRPPSLIEQLEKCWKTKQDNWAGPRAEEAMEKFQMFNDDHNISSEHLPESLSSASVNDQQLWLEAIGGAKKCRIWVWVQR
ncbi:UNVERIFIED_CONTAM: hypothetical protein Sradi_3321500 [Sesamum radiatum]|uniref:Uncharacterized protein n=1 Tax=Sesamum radiatum TaxID=300843 RepID=A0AAW2R3B0_SESRA